MSGGAHNLVAALRFHKHPLCDQAADRIAELEAAQGAPPVILVGIDSDGVAVIGLYETAERAQEAVRRGDVPHDANYSVMTPKINGYLQRKR